MSARNATIPISHTTTLKRVPTTCPRAASRASQDSHISQVGRERNYIHFFVFQYFENIFYVAVTSRSCSGAPAMSESKCSTHTINIMRTQICLCNGELCNGAATDEEQMQLFLEDPLLTNAAVAMKAASILIPLAIFFLLK